MVARGRKRGGYVFEQSGSVVGNLRSLPVHQSGGVCNVCAVYLTNGLMSQADSQNGGYSSSLFDKVIHDSGVLRPSRSRREDDSYRTQPFDFFDSDFIVTKDLNVSAQFVQILREIVSKRIVIVQ